MALFFIEEYEGAWTNYSNAPSFLLDDQMKTYSYTFEMVDPTDNNAGLCIEMGTINGETIPIDVIIDNVVIEETSDEAIENPITAEPWVQPTHAEDSYNIGDMIIYNGSVYRSLINANVWSPDVYPVGWQLVN